MASCLLPSVNSGNLAVLGLEKEEKEKLVVNYIMIKLFLEYSYCMDVVPLNIALRLLTLLAGGLSVLSLVGLGLRIRLTIVGGDISFFGMDGSKLSSGLGESVLSGFSDSIPSGFGESDRSGFGESNLSDFWMAMLEFDALTGIHDSCFGSKCSCLFGGRSSCVEGRLSCFGGGVFVEGKLSCFGEKWLSCFGWE